VLEVGVVHAALWRKLFCLMDANLGFGGLISRESTLMLPSGESWMSFCMLSLHGAWIVGLA
jgi:hypothetical protein